MKIVAASKFTIERIGKAPGSRRTLTVTDDGGFGWDDDFTTFMTFGDDADAEMFRTHRMLSHGDEAVVVRHSVH